MRYLVLPFLLFLLLPASAFAGEGLLVFKSNLWEKEGFARSLPYRSLEKFSTVHNVVDSTGGKTRVSSDLVLKDYPFPSANDLANLRDESQIVLLEAMVREWTAALRRFPSSAKYLKPRIASLQPEIARFRAGEVKADGQWMTKEVLEAKQRQLAAEREQLMAKLAKEAREMAMTAAEWESMDEAGRERAREARRAAQVAQIAMDEQRRVEAEIQRQAAITATRAQMKPFERLQTDESVLPPGLSDEMAKEYEAVLAKLNGELKHVRHELAFKREAQKLVILARDQIHTVRVKDLSSEVHLVKSDVAPDEPATLELRTRNGKESFLTFRKETDESRRTALIVIPTAAEMNVEKAQQAFSELITLATGTGNGEPGTNSSPAVQREPAPAVAETQKEEP